MPLNSPTDVEIINWLLRLIAGYGLIDIIRRLYRLEKKWDQSQTKCQECKEDILDRMVSKDYMDQWEKGREPIIQELRHHTHDKSGKYVGYKAA